MDTIPGVEALIAIKEEKGNGVTRNCDCERKKKRVNGSHLPFEISAASCAERSSCCWISEMRNTFSRTA